MEQAGGGGNHANGGGGFNGGLHEQSVEGNISNNGISTSDGASYYEKGVNLSTSGIADTGLVGGQGTSYCDNYGNTTNRWTKFVSGDGGAAGKGGNVKVSQNARIIAYNGDQITNGDYTSTYKYNVNFITNKIQNYSGSETVKTNEKLEPINTTNVLSRTKIIPTIIIAQNGICRETYHTDANDEDKKLIKITPYVKIAGNSYFTNYLATEAKKIATTGYKNGYMENQGIGSGAGYLEENNGTYKVESSLN